MMTLVISAGTILTIHEIHPFDQGLHQRPGDVLLVPVC